ncbi:MAG TPA: tetratricopeptide repeat protein [Terriglobia bacterium]
MINCLETHKVGTRKVQPVATPRLREERICWAHRLQDCRSAVSIGVLLLTFATSLAGSAQSQPDPATASPELIGKAKEAEQKQDFLTAARLYQDYLKAHPENPAILQRLGLVDYLSNRFEAAIPPLAKALQLDPSLWGSALYLGASYYHISRFTEAIDALKRSLALKPNVPETQFWMGCSLLADNQPEPAIAHLVQVSDDATWGVQAEDLLVKAYRKAAEDSYHRIATVTPDSYRVHLVKAELLAWKGINNEAVWEARQALQRNPSLEGAHRIIGEIYWQEKGFDLAAREFQAELQINPFDGESNLRVGEFWLAKGDPGKAASYLNVALDQRAGSPGEVHHFLGEVQLAQHNYAQAAANLEHAIQENPTDPANHQLLAQVYRASGQLDLAAKEEQLSHSARAPSSREQAP